MKDTIGTVIDQYNFRSLQVTSGQYQILSHPNDLRFTINDQFLFEMILMKIRATTISYASYKKQEDKVELDLEKEIRVLTDLIAKGDNSIADLLLTKKRTS